MDIVGSIVLLLLFSPIIIATAVAIKLDSDGPIIANLPKRVGQRNNPFFTYKFRSMINNAHILLKTDPKFQQALKEQQEAGNYKIMNDPRVTKVGRFIRKHSIDEIPQLFNVLKGEMSIVGPRPYYQDELEKQQERFPGTEEYVEQMLEAKPGITGYWQVSGRSEVAFDKRIKLDAYYANKKSILLDILILLKTPWIMLTGKGAA
jgi:lipopolysaccharide/colanic/teichoic acid biosynthesis glycosyltransferase